MSGEGPAEGATKRFHTDPVCWSRNVPSSACVRSRALPSASATKAATEPVCAMGHRRCLPFNPLRASGWARCDELGS